MSLYDDASLIMYPSGYKESKIYAQKPVNGTGDLTFTRASSATRVNAEGLIESAASNIPRIDYSNGCGSLLLEKQSTNLVTYSEDFSNAAWSKNSLTVTSDSAISPDGTLNATKITKSASNSLIRTFIATSGANTFSVYVKKGSLSWVRLYIASGTESAEAWFDLENGNIGHSSGNPNDIKIVPMDNGWYRCIITKNTTNITNFRIYPSKADDDTSGTSGDIYIWGGQVETNSSYATSYIPTSGTTTTRLADAASKTGISSVINSTEGVFYAEIANISEDNNSTVSISINDGSTSNAVSLYYFSTGGVYYDVFNSAGTRSGDTSMTKPQQAQNNKIALKYKSGDIALWVNGIEADTNSGTLSLSGLNQVDFHYGDGSVPFYGNVQNLMVFPSALTDDELADLTGSKITTFNSLALSRGYTIL